MTSFGDPNAPKFCYGRKEDTPVNWDLNWRNQITKEKREMAHNQALNVLRKSGQAPSGSSRAYHPAHVSTPKGPSALGRIRLGLCGTFIHEAGPAEIAPSRQQRKAGGRPASAAAGYGAGGGGGRPRGELERAGGLGRYNDQPQYSMRSSRSRGGMSGRHMGGSGGGGASGRYRPPSSFAGSGSYRAGPHGGGSDLEQRLQAEIRARKQAEQRIAELMLEVQRLKNGMALRA